MAIELAELIGRLREELTEAMHAGKDAELRFELGPVELELDVGVDREAKPGAKVRFWVLELGADATRSSHTTQRVTLQLVPRRTGSPRETPFISGGAMKGEE